MKITVQDRDHTYDAMWMITSLRFGKFSIRFKSKDPDDQRNKYVYPDSNYSGYDWGQLSVSQAKKLAAALDAFVKTAESQPKVIYERIRLYRNDI